MAGMRAVKLESSRAVQTVDPKAVSKAETMAVLLAGKTAVEWVVWMAEQSGCLMVGLMVVW